jgi:hypothetical protein
MAEQAGSIAEVLDKLSEADSGEAVSVGDVLGALQDRSLGVLLAALGLLAAIPIIGAIPGVSILVALMVLAVVAQSMLGGGELWAPEFVRARKIDDEKYQSALEKVRPYTDWIDRRLSRRLTVLVEGAAPRKIAAVAAAVLALAMIPLAIVPWGVQAPATGILAFGLALMRRDGLFALLGYVFAAITVWVFFYFT